MTRIVIVEDHPAIADGLAALIGAEDDIEIVGVAHVFEDASAVIRKTSPDVVLCDVMLAGRDDGFQLLRQFGPSSRFVMLTAYDYQSHHAVAVGEGAAGYLSKLSDAGTIVRTIRRVAAGETAIPMPIIDSARRAPQMPTPRERQLLAMLMRGSSNEDISFAMGIKVKTVEGMLRRLYDRYGTMNRTQLVRFSMRQGWLTNEPPIGLPEPVEQA
jgi:two-component system NarL family response regulator